MKKSFFTLLYHLICLACVDHPASIEKIDRRVLLEEAIGKDVQLLDVRTHHEYKRGHIDDALNLDVRDSTGFVEAASQLDKSRPVCILPGRGKEQSGSGNLA